MKYIVVYDNPEREYVVGISHPNEKAAKQHLKDCLERGMNSLYLYIIPEDDPTAEWLRASKRLF